MEQFDRAARSRIVFKPTGKAEEAFKMFASGVSEEKVEEYLRIYYHSAV